MTIDDLVELHNIAHLKNLPSIFEHGILSHERARRFDHESVAMEEIQGRRAAVVLPNGRRLHSYANLYINARNKMMFKIKDRHEELAVIRVAKGVIGHPGAIVADQNASSDRVRFSGGVDGLSRIEKAYVFARYWNHPDDQIESWRHGSAMCAEVLVPDVLPPRLIEGLYVSCEEVALEVRGRFPNVKVDVNGYLFFR